MSENFIIQQLRVRPHKDNKARKPQSMSNLSLIHIQMCIRDRDNPSVDFGMPGELVHFVEQFYKNGYEELLIASVSEKPTPHNIWMLHRCYNDINNPQRDKFAEVIRELKNEESISVEIKDAIDEFDWE